MQNKTTNKDLVEILEAMNDPERYGRLIQNAKDLYYHDWKAPEVVFAPKVDLVNELSKYPELLHIRNQVIDGVFDEDPDELDLRILKSDTPPELHDLLGL